MMNVLLFFCLFLFSCSLEATQASEFLFQTINISVHLSSPTVCSRASKNADLKKRASTTTVLEIVYKDGPCASLTNNVPIISSLADILVEDQLRIQSIQARVADTNKALHNQKSHYYYINKNKGLKNEKPTLPVRSGDPLGTSNYIVTIGLGTPVRNLTLVFDTGSDVMWTQCQPCALGNFGHCYPQKEPIFDPCASTTYSKIQCNSTECSELDKYEGGAGCYLNSTCKYSAFYGDRSYTIGFYSRDTLTVTPPATTKDVFPDFLFSCGQNNTGLFGETAGLLGLGRGPTSFVSQTLRKYSGVFSYCLPPDISSTGFLSLGGGKSCNNKNKNKMVIIPLIPSTKGFPATVYYYIEITGISVGGKKLPIKASVFTKAGAIIDSGTVVTRLPPAAYNVMKKEFKKQMMSKYRSAKAFSILDTCFHITTNIANVPTIIFTFKGNATLHLDPSGIIHGVDEKRACLAFAGNDNPTDLAIFGNTQQTNYEVMYDVPGNQLGFLKNVGCL